MRNHYYKFFLRLNDINFQVNLFTWYLNIHKFFKSKNVLTFRGKSTLVTYKQKVNTYPTFIYNYKCDKPFPVEKIKICTTLWNAAKPF